LTGRHARMQTTINIDRQTCKNAKDLQHPERNQPILTGRLARVHRTADIETDREGDSCIGTRKANKS